MKTSQRGIDLIESFESFAPKAYLCPAGKLTIGYGHVILKKDWPRLNSDSVLTETQAEELLAEDLADTEARVLNLVEVDLTQGQFDGLVSLTFNIGSGAFAGSTLLRKLNAGDYDGASKEFARWDKCNGKSLAGLARRRFAERDLFLGL